MKLMQKFFIVLLALLMLACPSTKVIDGVEYDTYGLFDAGDKRNPNIEYKICWGNVIWGAILFGTVIAPVYFFGFDMYEPVGKKNPNGIKGAISVTPPESVTPPDSLNTDSLNIKN